MKLIGQNIIKFPTERSRPAGVLLSVARQNFLFIKRAQDTTRFSEYTPKRKIV